MNSSAAGLFSVTAVVCVCSFVGAWTAGGRYRHLQSDGLSLQWCRYVPANTIGTTTIYVAATGTKTI